MLFKSNDVKLSYRALCNPPLQPSQQKAGPNSVKRYN